MNLQPLINNLNKWRLLYDALSLRERLLVLAAALVAIHFLWEGLMWQPIQNRQSLLKTKIEQQTTQITLLSEQAGLSLTNLKANPDAAAKERLNKMKLQLKEQQQQAKELEGMLIAPGRMAKMLEQMLNREGGLALIKLRSLESKPLFKPSAQQAKAIISSAMVVYKHSFEIEFEGDYFSTLEYMKALRRLPWKFFWSRFEYKVNKYPYAAVKMRLYTLSLSKEWIGV